MKKTFTINISGTIFHIEEDAFEKLQRYFLNLKKHFGSNTEGQEIMNDIENRIAELFTEWSKGESKIITIDWVDDVIKTMGTTEDFEQEIAESEEYRTQSRNRRRLYRNPDDRIIAGVCSGLAVYFNMDSTIIRIIFVLLIFGSGAGFLAYIILWIAVPKAATTAQRLEMRGEEVNVTNIQRTVRDLNSDENDKKKDETGEITPDMPTETHEENEEESSAPENDNGEDEAPQPENNDDIVQIEETSEEKKTPVVAKTKYYNQKDYRQSSAKKKERDVSSNVGKSILRMFAIIIGAFLLFTGFLGLIATVSTFIFGQQLFADGGWYFGNGFQFGGMINNFISDDSITLGVIALLLFVGIPFAALFFIGAKMIFRFKSNNVAVGLGMVGLWLVSMIVFLLVSAGQIGNFRGQSTIIESESISCNTCTTLYLDVNSDKYADYDYIDWDNNRYKMVQIGDENVVLGKPRFDIKKSDGNHIEISFKKRARGKNNSDATKYINEIVYTYQVTDSLIYFDSYFQTGSRNKWRDQRMDITLKIPVGMKVYMANNMKEIVYDIDNVTNTWDRDMVEKYWEMRPEGLTLVEPAKAIKPAEPVDTVDSTDI